ncbi:MAG: MlaD family protein [Bryobacter sp.]|nr:MlaD family protein [Bryobacter sp.]
MASTTKTSWAQLRVGLLAIFAMAMLGVLVFYMTSQKSVFGSEALIYTYMEGSGGLLRGAPVRLNGILIGKVMDVEFSGDNRKERTVRIKMLINEEQRKNIPADSDAMLAIESLLSGKYVLITRGKAPQPVAANAELASRDVSEIEDIVQQGVTTLNALQAILKRVEAIVAQIEVGKGTIGKLLVDEELYRKILGVADDVQKITHQMQDGKGTLGKLVYDDKLYDEIRGSAQRIDTLLADLQAGQGTAGKFLKDPAVYDEARQSITQLRKILEDANAGKGTMGKLLKDEQLHNEVLGSVKRLNSTIDRLNAGQGTLGQLLVNPQLYENINGLTVEMNSFMKDFRANPKKFLSIKLGLF